MPVWCRVICFRVVWKRTKSRAARRQIRHRRWHIVDNSMQAKAKPEAQLGDRRSQSHEPRRVGRGKSPPNPSSIHQVESIQSVGSVGSVASIHSKKSNIPYWYCPLCTPSLTLPPSSLKCLQKSNPNIHRKCFRCFKCFGCFRCFISLLDHKTARFWPKSEQNPQTARIVTPSSNGYGKHPKRQFTHLPTNTILCVL